LPSSFPVLQKGKKKLPQGNDVLFLQNGESMKEKKKYFVPEGGKVNGSFASRNENKQNEEERDPVPNFCRRNKKNRSQQKKISQTGKERGAARIGPIYAPKWGGRKKL